VRHRLEQVGMGQSGDPPGPVLQPMAIRPPRPQDSPAWVVKVQILAAVFVPMLGLALWLRTQGFW
jgi:hypothetical protein